MPKAKTFPTKNDLAPDVRDKAIVLLNQHLAGTSDLYTQIKQAHWNVKGMPFQGMAAAASRLSEYPLEAVDGRQHVEALVARFASLAKTARAAIDTATAFGDADTADVFTEVSRRLDKHLWFLEAHLSS
jgi:starvation-inducible DNA-binding protein